MRTAPSPSASILASLSRLRPASGAGEVMSVPTNASAAGRDGAWAATRPRKLAAAASTRSPVADRSSAVECRLRVTAECSPRIRLEGLRDPAGDLRPRAGHRQAAGQRGGRPEVGPVQRDVDVPEREGMGDAAALEGRGPLDQGDGAEPVARARGGATIRPPLRRGGRARSWSSAASRGRRGRSSGAAGSASPSTAPIVRPAAAAAGPRPAARRHRSSACRTGRGRAGLRAKREGSAGRRNGRRRRPRSPGRSWRGPASTRPPAGSRRRTGTAPPRRRSRQSPPAGTARPP